MPELRQPTDHAEHLFHLVISSWTSGFVTTANSTHVWASNTAYTTVAASDLDLGGQRRSPH